jgi:hypothetical protein
MGTGDERPAYTALSEGPLSERTALSERTPSDRARPWLTAATAALGWGFFTIVVLHVISSHNPVRDTLSSYAFTDRGTGMLAASMLSLAISSLALLGALLAAGIPVSRTTGTLFGSWSGGLALAAVFPASYPENPSPVSGHIHQYSCLVAFLSVPALGISLLDRLRGSDRHRTRIARWTKISVGGVLLFGLSYLLALFPRTPVLGQFAAMLPVGFTQRIALAVDLVLLCALMMLARATATGDRVVSGNLPEGSVPRGGGELGSVAVETGQATGVQEDDRLVRAEVAAISPVDQRGRGLAGVNGVQHGTFGAGEQP